MILLIDLMSSYIMHHRHHHVCVVLFIHVSSKDAAVCSSLISVKLIKTVWEISSRSPQPLHGVTWTVHRRKPPELFTKARFYMRPFKHAAHTGQRWVEGDAHDLNLRSSPRCERLSFIWSETCSGSRFDCLALVSWDEMLSLMIFSSWLSSC